MSGVSETFLAARQADGDAQERNRAWWEALPMTYVEWDKEHRDLIGGRHAAHALLAANPFLHRSHFWRSGDVLEIGCGAGGATTLFCDYGANVTAIDLTDAAVAMTSQNEPRATVLRMDVEQMTFPDGSFDHVFSWGVIHHTSSTERAVEQIARVLRPGGTGLIMVYNRNSLRYWMKGLQWLYFKKPRKRGETMDSVQRFFTDGYFHRHFSSGEFRRLLRGKGLAVTAIHKTHMAKRMVPMVPLWLDNLLKRHWGWLLVAEIAKSPAR
jgi:SAM-dependent methyltransferase